MKLPNQAQAISRRTTPGAAAVEGVRASDAACAASCNQLTGAAREMCLANCS